jgi:hypothetical protein
MLLGFVVTALGRTRALALAKIGNILASTILSLLLVPIFQARWGNGGLGIVVAFSASELLMLFTFVAVLPTGTLDKTTFLDAARAVLASFGTLALFWLLPPLSPWLGIPLCVAAFGLLALTVGLVSRAEFAKFSNLLRRN